MKKLLISLLCLTQALSSFATQSPTPKKFDSTMLVYASAGAIGLGISGYSLWKAHKNKKAYIVQKSKHKELDPARALKQYKSKQKDLLTNAGWYLGGIATIAIGLAYINRSFPYDHRLQKENTIVCLVSLGAISTIYGFSDWIWNKTAKIQKL